MNKDRRAELDTIGEALRGVSLVLTNAKETLEGLKEQLELHKDDEQEYFDNMPEAFQQGDRGQTAEAAIDEMESAMTSLEEAIEHIGSAQA